MAPPLITFFCWTLPILLWDGLRLFGLVICLAPGFVRFAWFYFVAARRTSIRFGTESCRQTLDLYSLQATTSQETSDVLTYPNNSSNISSEMLVKAPVVLFYTGGAWLIGYKMWGTLLARAFTAAGIVVVIPDMRNYPWGSVPSMVEDVDDSIAWTIANIADYGGDPSKIVVVGQSAGGHVACTALLRRAQRRLLDEEQGDSKKSTRNDQRLDNNDYLPPTRNQDGECDTIISPSSSSSWRPTDLKGFVSLSAPYCLLAMQESLQRHGLDDQLVDRIFGGERDKYDPMLIVKEFQKRNKDPKLVQKSSSLLPNLKIYHGEMDKTVPYSGSETFCQELRKAVVVVVPSSSGAKNDDKDLVVDFHLYKDWTHTDPILEGPMDADQRFHKDLFDLVKEWTNSRHLIWPENDPVIRDRLCPSILVRAARFCNPF
jgi:prenylcysteine alpha-carboxyl methylesterase